MNVHACLTAFARAHARHARPEETRAALHLPGSPFPSRLLLAPLSRGDFAHLGP